MITTGVNAGLIRMAAKTRAGDVGAPAKCSVTQDAGAPRAVCLRCRVRGTCLAAWQPNQPIAYI